MSCHAAMNIISTEIGFSMVLMSEMQKIFERRQRDKSMSTRGWNITNLAQNVCGEECRRTTETHFLQQTHSWIRVLVSCNDPSKVCWTASCMLLWLSPPWFQPPHLDLLTQSTHSPVAAFTRTPLLCQSVVLVPLPAVWMPNCPWAVY